MNLPRFDTGTLMLLVLFAGFAAYGFSCVRQEQSPFAGPALLLFAPPAGFLMICAFLMVYYRKI